MFRRYYPCEHVKSVFFIDYNKLYELGYRGIIFDLDNTLVHHGDDSNEKVDNLFKEIHNIGFKTIILSDNDDKRIMRFLKNIDSLYISEANKPNVEGFNKAVKMLNLEKDKCIVIGDQVFTDIYGANKSGIDSILVNYIKVSDNEKIGKKRRVEKVILKFYNHNKKYNNRIGDILIRENSMSEKKKKLFCELNPACYAISMQKEIVKRHLKDLKSKDKFCKTIEKKKLPNVVYEYSSHMIKKGKGIDPVLQENKAVNIELACSKINGMIIHPGETFSFWRVVGKPTKRKGYKDGRVIEKNKLKPGLGGGLCNLGNTIHRMVLHSPLDVVESHYHSDALAPDGGKRVPLSTGTSISYNNIDLRFKNNTDQDIQILLRCEDGNLIGELRSEKEFPYTYDLLEENHHFKKEGEKYFRVSKIYRETNDRKSKKVVKKELVRDNHSEVMFDYDLIPKELIKK